MPMSGDSFVDGNGVPFEDFRQLGAQKLSAACNRGRLIGWRPPARNCSPAQVGVSRDAPENAEN
jgi:hypothetical protein